MTPKEYFSELLYQKAYTRAIAKNIGLATREFRVSFRQFFHFRDPLFSLFRALKYAFYGALRVFMGRSIKLSYSFMGEDLLIENLAKPLIYKDGFYVDVGCNEPRFISNSFLFYRRGWRGICVDANAQLIRKHRRLRPKDKAVCALVSNETKPLTYYQLTNSGLSTVQEEFLEGYLKEGQKILRTEDVIPRTLTEILDENGAPADFDFLTLDVEDHDYQALLSLDLTKYRPRIIIVEDELLELEKLTDNKIYVYLIGSGYKLAGCILTNVYYERVPA